MCDKERIGETLTSEARRYEAMAALKPDDVIRREYLCVAQRLRAAAAIIETNEDKEEH